MPACPCCVPVVTGVPVGDGRVPRRARWVPPGWAMVWGGGRGVEVDASRGPGTHVPAVPIHPAPHREALAGPAVPRAGSRMGPRGAARQLARQHGAAMPAVPGMEPGGHSDAMRGHPCPGRAEVPWGWPRALGPRVLPHSPRQWGVKVVAGAGSSFVSVRSRCGRRCHQSVAGMVQPGVLSTVPQPRSPVAQPVPAPCVSWVT